MWNRKNIQKKRKNILKYKIYKNNSIERAKIKTFERGGEGQTKREREGGEREREGEGERERNVKLKRQ